ncbi:hypothetical protein DCAR_0208277 [Daucus carota subsp. sativus]|uniref:Vesicle transport protein n=1 Tax=Daucus carota subsp. sativus TaxID=79200 RepID=A0AAF1AQV9_DAUCS|nr:PREDICTED: uncharacterized protein LOC108206119 [Daucus carota subsp. sativus]WOG89041.1 hypothetical protein DCAR_0208277 [Daucus carota subsp. sativus]
MTVVSKTEVNLRRLLAAAPRQENQAKLVHYVATLRELLEQLTEEKTPEGLPRISKAKVNEYSEKIQAVATKLATPVSDAEIAEEPILETSSHESSPRSVGNHIPESQGLRRRSSIVKERYNDNVVTDQSMPVKLDNAAQTHIAKHRKLQEDLTDEMVVLARQLKESSQMMSQSLKNTENILDSTEKAVEQSLASTGHANTRAMEVYSHSFKTTCFTWLAIFAMTCIFIMVVLLIRVT